jgi:pSer/pThr/pTyr-binding forkhead associated (FHA) protein
MGLAKLVLTEPFKPRKTILINQNPFLIGRTNDCNLVLERHGVSKHQAQITFDGESYQIKDMGSKNGTLLNGKN